MRHTRRDIVKTLAALPLIRLNRAEPDVVLYNGVVSTMNPGQPEATAIAIRNARFLAAGSDRDVLSLRRQAHAPHRSRAAARISRLQRCTCASLAWRHLCSQERRLRQELDRRNPGSASCTGGGDGAGALGAGLPLRRWQDTARADARRPRRRGEIRPAMSGASVSAFRSPRRCDPPRSTAPMRRSRNTRKARLSPASWPISSCSSKIRSAFPQNAGSASRSSGRCSAASGCTRRKS